MCAGVCMCVGVCRAWVRGGYAAGIFISHIVPNGSAALSEHLLVGDRIVTVGGVPIIGKSIDEARELLAACANTEVGGNTAGVFGSSAWVSFFLHRDQR